MSEFVTIENKKQEPNKEIKRHSAQNNIVNIYKGNENGVGEWEISQQVPFEIMCVDKFANFDKQTFEILLLIINIFKIGIKRHCLYFKHQNSNF